MVIKLGRTQTESARELGTTRESLHRALRGFVERDLIRISWAQVTLVDPAGLAAYAG